MPNPSLVRRHKGLLRHTLHQLLHVDLVRYAVARLRFEWFVRVKRSLRTLEQPQGVAPNTISHNLRGVKDLAVARSLYLIRPLSVIESIAPDADVLLIGPRTEGELLAMLAHGFDLPHLRALDLITYSPWVDLGDMHAMPFDADSFDVAVLGWVLAYSDDRRRAATEISRVVRPGGVVAIGVEWSPQSDEELEAELGYVPGSRDRIGSCDQVLSYFGRSVGRVLVKHDIEEHRRNEVGAMVVIFTLDES